MEAGPWPAPSDPTGPRCFPGRGATCISSSRQERHLTGGGELSELGSGSPPRLQPRSCGLAARPLLLQVWHCRSPTCREPDRCVPIAETRGRVGAGTSCTTLTSPPCPARRKGASSLTSRSSSSRLTARVSPE